MGNEHQMVMFSSILALGLTISVIYNLVNDYCKC